MTRGINIRNMLRYESFIIVGIVMTFATLVKLLGFIDFSSDWLWFIAGLGLILEGAISLFKQRRFDKKFKIIEIGSEEYKKLFPENSINK